MTQRQKQITALVNDQREKLAVQIKDAMRDQPIGWTVGVRLPVITREYWGVLSLLVTKESDHRYSWVEDNPLLFTRKGRTGPRPKMLVLSEDV